MKKILLTISAVITIMSASSQTMSPFWNIQQNTNFPQPSMGAIMIDVVNANVVWAIGNYGSTGATSEFYSRTINGGTNYTSGNVFPDTNSWFISNIDGIDANNAWIAAHKNQSTNTATVDVIYHTANGGINWNDGGNTSMFTDAAAYADWVTFLTPTLGVAMGDQNPTTSNKHEIWRTVDGGTTWTLVPAANIPAPSGSTDYGLENSVTTFSTNYIWYGTGAGHVFRSTDAGQTWSVSSTGANSYVTDIAFTSANNGLCFGYTGTTLGLYRTTDGGATWTPVTVQPTLGERAICAVPGSNYYASCSNVQSASAPSTISVSYDQGTTWNSWGGTGIGYLDIGFFNTATGFAGAFSNSVTATIGGMYKYNGFPLTVNNNTNLAPIAINTYPNPSNGIISVMIPLTKSEVVLSITDVLGNVVHTEALRNSLHPETTLNLQHLAKGVYNMSFSIDTQKYFQRIVIE